MVCKNIDGKQCLPKRSSGACNTITLSKHNPSLKCMEKESIRSQLTLFPPACSAVLYPSHRLYKSSAACVVNMYDSRYMMWS